MKIIAGEKRGHTIVAPRGSVTRPTLGRVRESIFSILSNDIVEASVIDLFAGAGTLGLEALSRGAAHCTFVENNPEAIKALRQNIEKLGVNTQATIVARDLFSWIRGFEFPAEPIIMFADPPYHLGLADELLLMLGRKTIFPGSILVLQYGKRDKIEAKPNSLRSLRVEVYGETRVQFFASISPGNVG